MPGFKPLGAWGWRKATVPPTVPPCSPVPHIKRHKPAGALSPLKFPGDWI